MENISDDYQLDLEKLWRPLRILQAVSGGRKTFSAQDVVILFALTGHNVGEKISNHDKNKVMKILTDPLFESGIVKRD